VRAFVFHRWADRQTVFSLSTELPKTSGLPYHTPY
jgi:hypothetical protein